jgi:hypothetical protein
MDNLNEAQGPQVVSGRNVGHLRPKLFIYTTITVSQKALIFTHLLM